MRPAVALPPAAILLDVARPAVPAPGGPAGPPAVEWPVPMAADRLGAAADGIDERGHQARSALAMAWSFCIHSELEPCKLSCR